MRCVGLLLLSAAFCHAQPQIFYRGIVNAASYMPPGLPGGAIARGSMFSVFGRRLGPASSPTLSFPLQTTLGGVSIAVTQGGTTVNAIPVFVSAGQVNAILPSNTPLGLVSLRVTFNNQRSNPAPLRVVDSAFGIFTATGTGSGPGIVQNFIAADQQPINSLQTSAQPGQVGTLWGTGLGPVSFPDNVAPTPGSLSVQTEVFVGGRPARVLYNGRAPCCSAIDQIVFEVPPDAPAGCWVPVHVRTAGSTVSNFVTMAIGESGGCAESSNALPSALISGGKVASFVAARISILHDVAVRRSGETVADWAGGFLAEERAAPFNFNPAFSLPPPGSCTVYAMNGSFPKDVDLLPGMLPTVRLLDAGALTLTGGRGARTISSLSVGGFASGYLGGVVRAIAELPNSSYLEPGSYTLSGAGGRDVGAFQTTLDVAPPIVWSNRAQVSNVDRTRPLTLSWTGGRPDNIVFAAGGAADLPTNSSAVFLCLANAGDGSLTVPASVLANIPAARPRLTQSIGGIYLGEWSLKSPARFTASGLDTGLATVAGVSAKTVAFR